MPIWKAILPSLVSLQAPSSSLSRQIFLQKSHPRYSILFLCVFFENFIFHGDLLSRLLNTQWRLHREARELLLLLFLSKLWQEVSFWKLYTLPLPDEVLDAILFHHLLSFRE